MPDPGQRATPAKKEAPWKTWLSQVIRFGVVGILNTVVDWFVYFALTRWVGLASMPVLAKGISYGAGVINSYAWNKNWTFRARESGFQSMLPFFGVSLIALGVNAAVLELGLNTFSLGELASLVLATGFTLLWNFLMSKFVVFRA